MKKLAVVLGVIFSSMAMAETHVVTQKNQEFSHDKITVKAGDVVKFTNEDSTFHNIYSLSDTEIFDLGSFENGESREHTFNNKGEVEVECAIHPNMKMTVVVE